jgi:hypothetical protein
MIYNLILNMSFNIVLFTIKKLFHTICAHMSLLVIHKNKVPCVRFTTITFLSFESYVFISP